MYISKLKIKNFKCFKEVSILFDPNFNVIIGGNNSGKSTIFEALRLWQHAFNRFLKDRTNNKSSSFYASQYFSFTLEDLSFLRIENFNNLFNSRGSAKGKFEITVTLNGNEKSVELPIKFDLTTEAQNLKFELCQTPSDRPNASELLSEVLEKPKGSDFKDSLLFTYINPIFHLPLKEPCFQKGYIINKLHQAKANEVIRNLIHPIAPLRKQNQNNPNRKLKGEKLEQIENTIDKILLGNDSLEKKHNFLSFSSKLEEEDVHISIYASNSENNSIVEINQLGSGTLNILNILSVLAFGDYENFKLNALLLDEPDSHLHSNHQKKLFEHLKNVSMDENKQMFVITHNHELIDCTDNVLFLDPNRIKGEKQIKPIPKDDYYVIYKEIAPEYHQKMLEIADKKEIEKKLNDLTKPTIYCEGTSDVSILTQAFKKLYDQESFFNDEINLEGGGGEGEVGNKLKNNKTENAIIGILDNDYAGQSQMKKIVKDHSFVESSDIYFHKGKSHLLMLPIPKFRLESATYFETKTFIEYLFNDDVLENKLKIELKQYRGENFKRFDEKSLDKIKTELVKNIDQLDKNDFIHFIPLFEKIAKIIDFKLLQYDSEGETMDKNLSESRL